MPYTGVILDGSVTNAKLATGTLSGDRLAANFNYASDMTVQRLSANKCLLPAVTGYSCCCYGGYFYGACGLCACGSVQGALICGNVNGLMVWGRCGYGANICACCGTGLCVAACNGQLGSFCRYSCGGCGYTVCECQSVQMGYCGSSLCASYSCWESACLSTRCASVVLAIGDCGIYTPSKAHLGGGLIVGGCAGGVEGALVISCGYLCYYSCGNWHPVCRVC